MLSKLAMYDELIRNYDQLAYQNSTKEFLEFVNNQEECRQKWEAADKECGRLQNEVTTCQQEIGRQERKIQEVRRHLENKMEIVTKLESENERFELRCKSACGLLINHMNDPKASSDAKERLRSVLAVLESGDMRKSTYFFKSPIGGMDAISEAGSTDLSMTQSEDDLDISGARPRKPFAKRQSTDKMIAVSKRARKSGQHQALETVVGDKLVAKTVVTFPKDGQIHAVASLETFQASKGKSTETQMFMRPTAPPMPVSESESDMSYPLPLPSRGHAAQSPMSHQASLNAELPSVSPRFGRTLSSGGPMAMRHHAFCHKTVIKPETCEPCGKRIKFSKQALKCRDCKATCHPECKDMVPLPCVMPGTPSGSKAQMGNLADYAPSSHPMVPALIQHCVNEVEVRGFTTVGLYRVPGPEKEVKELKDRFLRGKGVPNLGNYDIHAICGCIKDFLRSIQEPLIGRWFWRDFALACDISDRTQRQASIDRIINDLPPSNQDTMAFVILHLQRVAEEPAVKMPTSNLAKVFGPTIVGYSGPELDAQTMLKETKKQQAVLETLLSMPTDFWTKFFYRRDDDLLHQSNNNLHGTFTRSKANAAGTSICTPQNSSVLRVKDSRRKIYFTDESPKETPKTKNKRTYFE